jgi:hypothetical protein
MSFWHRHRPALRVVTTPVKLAATQNGAHSRVVVVVHEQHVVVAHWVEVDRILEERPVAVVHEVVLHDRVRRRAMQGDAIWSLPCQFPRIATMALSAPLNAAGPAAVVGTRTQSYLQCGTWLLYCGPSYRRSHRVVSLCTRVSLSICYIYL